MKVLCFGSLNIDYVYSVDHFVEKGETLSSTGLEVFTGGKGLNCGSEVRHAQLAEMLQEKTNGATVVLTLGGKGSICTHKDSMFTQNAFRVSVVDTTAAGDTFTGFFIGGLLSGKPIPGAMKEASAAAAIACSRPGAAPSIPTLGEVKEFLLQQVN